MILSFTCRIASALVAAQKTRLSLLVVTVMWWLELCNDRDNSSSVVVIALAVAVQTSSIETHSNNFVLQTLAVFSEFSFLKCLPL